MTNKPRSKFYLFWFRKAEEDELSAGAVLKEGAPSTGCFLAQQMAEKYLKGMVAFFRIKIRKVHDLLVLKELLLDVAPGISQIDKDLILLDSYYTGTRTLTIKRNFLSKMPKKLLKRR